VYRNFKPHLSGWRDSSNRRRDPKEIIGGLISWQVNKHRFSLMFFTYLFLKMLIHTSRNTCGSFNGYTVHHPRRMAMHAEQRHPTWKLVSQGRSRARVGVKSKSGPLGKRRSTFILSRRLPHSSLTILGRSLSLEKRVMTGPHFSTKPPSHPRFLFAYPIKRESRKNRTCSHGYHFLSDPCGHCSCSIILSFQPQALLGHNLTCTAGRPWTLHSYDRRAIRSCIRDQTVHTSGCPNA